MYDINFYMKSYSIWKKMKSNKEGSKEKILDFFENFRSKYPIIYNIETTNACNMKCKMCPRTTKMTRDITFLKQNIFENIIKQIKPHDEDLWKKWEIFCIKTYGIKSNDKASENHFFLYIIPKVIQLHGYGDPLLDNNMAKYIKFLSNNRFYSYFSCNPININIEKTIEMFENGLNYIKYSIESINNIEHKKIRGEASNFTESYKNIIKLLELKKKNNYKTTIIITMLNLNRTNQINDFKKLKRVFQNYDVYIYLKSEDQLWYRKNYHNTKSIHWLEFCKHPWMSMTIKSNDEVAMCMEDYNNEIILGNARTDSLYDIWNGLLYKKFREDHFNKNSCIKCFKECDMLKIGSNWN